MVKTLQWQLLIAAIAVVVELNWYVVKVLNCTSLHAFAVLFGVWRMRERCSL